MSLRMSLSRMAWARIALVHLFMPVVSALRQGAQVTEAWPRPKCKVTPFPGRLSAEEIIESVEVGLGSFRGALTELQGIALQRGAIQPTKPTGKHRITFR